jgi:hypothetical protein
LGVSGNLKYKRMDGSKRKEGVEGGSLRPRSAQRKGGRGAPFLRNGKGGGGRCTPLSVQRKVGGGCRCTSLCEQREVMHPMRATAPSVEAFLASSRRLFKNTKRNASTDGTAAPRGPERRPPTDHRWRLTQPPGGHHIVGGSWLPPTPPAWLQNKP